MRNPTQISTQDEVENSYVLHEIESKMNAEDLQRWRESLKETLDKRQIPDAPNYVFGTAGVRKVSQLRNLA